MIIKYETIDKGVKIEADNSDILPSHALMIAQAHCHTLLKMLETQIFDFIPDADFLKKALVPFADPDTFMDMMMMYREEFLGKHKSILINMMEQMEKDAATNNMTDEEIINKIEEYFTKGGFDENK